MRCNWLLALSNPVRKRAKREFAGCFSTRAAAQKKADQLNSSSCWNPGYRGLCWLVERPLKDRIFSPMIGSTQDTPINSVFDVVAWMAGYGAMMMLPPPKRVV